MKTKFYFLTLAASVAFAACTNDELDNIKGTDVQNSEWVALNDVHVNVFNGVDSRINASGWESTDEVGVGFTNWYANSALVNGTNDVLYANHRLFRTEGTWKFENVVYEGMHFAYFPLKADHKKVEALSYELGTEQVYGQEEAYKLNGIFAVSPLYDLKGDQSGKAPVVNFDLKTISNRLTLNLELANFDGIVDPIIVKNVKIVDKTANPFAQSVTLGDLPEAVYTAQNALTEEDKKDAAKVAKAVADDEKATNEAFEADIISAMDCDATNEISTTVKGHTGFTADATSYGVHIFFFPVENAQAADVDVIVETNYGNVTIDGTTVADSGLAKEIDEANNKEMQKLQKAFQTDGAFTSFGKGASLTLKVNMDDAVLTSVSASNATEWADAIRIASQKEVATVNVTGDITVDLTELPQTVNTIKVTADKTLTVSGEIADQNLTIEGTVKVAASTSLTVNGTVAKPANLTITTIENLGEITVGENGTLNATTVNNHATMVNNNKMVITTLTNDKVTEKTDAHNYICKGIFKNYANLNATTVNNKGDYYSIGAKAVLTNTTFTNEGIAYTEQGGSLAGITTGKRYATVATPFEMNSAVTAGATQITVTGIVSLDENLAATTNVILKEGAELYILAETLVGVNEIQFSTNYLNITVEGSSKISATKVQDMNSLTVVAGAKLEVLEGSQLNVATLAYDVNSEVANAGEIYAQTISKNLGTWTGTAANKKADGTGMNAPF